MSTTKSQKHSARSRVQPYPKERPVANRKISKPLIATSPPSSQPTSSSSPEAVKQHDDGTARRIYIEIVRARYPNFVPRNNYDLFTLSGESHYEGDGSNEDLRAFLDKKLSCAADYAGAMELADKMLSVPGDEISGVKPRAGDKYVSICEIPGTEYSLRLWPACVSRREFCLDFVRADTKEPVNTPPGFDLYATTPGMPATHKLVSLERAFFPSKPIAEGSEKYLLVEGQMLLLRCKGVKDFRFTVPTHPKAPPPAEPVGDTLHFSF